MQINVSKHLNYKCRHLVTFLLFLKKTLASFTELKVMFLSVTTGWGEAPQTDSLFSSMDDLVIQ